MAKKPVRQDPPIEFPAARLFLDDLEEIIRVFWESRRFTEEPDTIQKPVLNIRLGTWECDSLDDLRTLANKATKEFFLDMADEYRFHSTFYMTKKVFNGWGDSGLSDDGKWAVFAQINSIIEKRRIRWSPWRRPQIIFQNSYEYKGVMPVLRRHGTAIAVAVITAVVTLVARGLIEQLIHYLRRR
jgi:hypothetical protein